MWGIKYSFCPPFVNGRAVFFTLSCSVINFFVPRLTPSQNIFGCRAEGNTPVLNIEVLKWLRFSASSSALVNFGMSIKKTFPKKKRVIWIFSEGSHLICPELCAKEDWISESMGWISLPAGIPINRRFSNSSFKGKAGDIQGSSCCNLPVDMPLYPENIFFHPRYFRRYNADIYQPCWFFFTPAIRARNSCGADADIRMSII